LAQKKRAGAMAMSKDDMTPYDLACFLTLQGLLASGFAGQPEGLAKATVECVDALFAELKKKEAR
jgi:hypothetical protein